MARRMTGRVDEADARSHLGLARDLADVLPGREDGLDATRQSFSRFGQPIDHRRVGPEFVFNVRDGQLGIREHRLVGFLFHQPEDVIGMAVGDQNRIDLGGIDPGRLHVAHHLAGGGLHLPACAAVAHHRLAAVLDHQDGERDRDEVGGQSSFDHRRLHVVERGVGDECRIVRLFPDAVVEGGDFGRADLVGHGALGRISRLLREGGRDREPGVEAERSRHGGGNHEVATRQVEHRTSPRAKFKRTGGATGADGVETRPAGGLFPAGNESDHIGLNARSSSTSISIGSSFLNARAMRSVVSCTVLARSAATPSERARETKSTLGSTSSIPT